MSIRIKNKSIDIPLVQGAMAIGMSSPDLVGGVARRGGIGTLSMVNPGYKEKDFLKNTFEANKRAYLKDLKYAKEKSQERGIILTNLMQVVERFEDYFRFFKYNRCGWHSCRCWSSPRPAKTHIHGKDNWTHRIFRESLEANHEKVGQVQ